MSNLTAKQQRFVEEYLVDLNATQAAIRAGYSSKTAEQQGFQLLQKTSVAAAISEHRAKVSKRIGRTIDDIMADIGRVRENAMQTVLDIETGANVMVSHKDALKALELEGKRFGAWTDKIDHTNSDGSLRPSVIRIVAEAMPPKE